MALKLHILTMLTLTQVQKMNTKLVDWLNPVMVTNDRKKNNNKKILVNIIKRSQLLRNLLIKSTCNMLWWTASLVHFTQCMLPI